MTNFDRDTFAEALGEGRYRVRMNTRWWVVRGPNGGYVAACLVNAMRGEVDPERALRSLTVHYVGAPAEGEAEIVVRVERVGRSLTSVSARLEQDGRVMALALAAFAVDYDGAVAYAAPMPQVTPFDAIEPISGDGRPAFGQNFDIRPALGALPFTGGDEPLTGGWILLGEERPLDEPLVVALTDAWWPAPFAVVTTPVVAPTIDLTVHLRAPLPRTAEPVFLRVWSTTARQGFFEEDVEMRAADGTLLAQARQLALLR